ncbi:Asp23/Gls24 family envelope stress response protein [Cryptosporangium arvum]|uniref:Asp23/Gls24 family envelope stress response protein n=1 Tax=Cryptosporangium arvum TaxID=80871 RepID=UPI0004BB756C|nr:Asp23/Gls24 family envelope stress response protein [Cryptosporangium arvum]
MADRPVAGPASADDEPGGRGRLVIEDRAVQRIAEAAATRVVGVVPAAQSVGALSSALGRAYPRVDCDVAAGRVRADVEIVALWPTPAAHLGEQVRDAVTDQLHRLAGLQVDAVDVTIADLVRVAAPARRRVR